MDFIFNGTLLYYIAPGIFLGLGLALRRPGRVPAECWDSPAARSSREAWEYAQRVAPEVALWVGWALLAASLMAHGLGGLMNIPVNRVLGVCLVLDVVSLAAYLGFMEMMLRRRFQCRG